MPIPPPPTSATRDRMNWKYSIPQKNKINIQSSFSKKYKNMNKIRRYRFIYRFLYMKNSGAYEYVDIFILIQTWTIYGLWAFLYICNIFVTITTEQMDRIDIILYNSVINIYTFWNKYTYCTSILKLMPLKDKIYDQRTENIVLKLSGIIITLE